MSQLFYRTVLQTGGYEVCCGNQCGELILSGDECVCAELSTGRYFSHESCVQKSTPSTWKKELRYESRNDIEAMGTSEVALPTEGTFGAEMSLVSELDAERIGELTEHAQREQQMFTKEVISTDRHTGTNGKALLAGQPQCARIGVGFEDGKAVAAPQDPRLRNHASQPQPTDSDIEIDKHWSVMQYLRDAGQYTPQF